MTYVPTKRRGFLCTALSLGASGFLHPAGALAKLMGTGAGDPLAAKLAAFFVHRDSAAVVGLEYLRCVPREAEVHVLVDLLCAGQPERRIQLTHAGMERLRKVLLAQQREDFERGRAVKVHGWILSETEARLSALAALS